MATKVTLKEAEELSRHYLSNGMVAFTEDLQNLYMDYSEFPDGPSRIYFYREGYFTHMIEKFEDSSAEDYAVVTRYENTPGVVLEFCRGSNKADIAAGIYGRPKKEYMKHSGHEYVDLGLPSGIKWAQSCQFMHYTWGEVIQSKYSRAKKNVEKRTNVTCIQADASMDAARYNWGGKWRMPNIADYQELIDCCNWRYRKYGFLITGPNGNTLFLPTSGPDYTIRRLWTSESPFGEDKATALFMKENSPEFCEVSTENHFTVWPVFLDGDEESQDVERIRIVKKGTVKIGGGQRMPYTISEDLTLTVKGNLAYGRDKDSLFPIKYDAYWPHHLVVADGVETIGRQLFMGSYFKTIKLPDSLKDIEAWAFAEIRGVESISLPSGLRKIGECAFSECPDLKEVILPEGLEFIGEYAFRGTSIKEIHIPKTVKNLPSNAFDDCTKII